MVNTKTFLLASAVLLSSATQGPHSLQDHLPIIANPNPAHPGPHAEPDAAIMASRSAKAKQCANQIGAMKQKRHLQRKREAARKRDAETSFVAPSYDFISNASCILTPELSNGPYWLPASETIRQDITDGEVGVPLQLDIGVIDVNTCEPMEDVLVSIWVPLFFLLRLKGG